MIDGDLIHHVHAVFGHALTVRDRLESGELVQREKEQTKLQLLLAPLEPVSLWDTQAAESLEFDFSAMSNQDDAQLTRETVRCALTCWIDEFFLRYSALSDDWKQQPLETVLYDSQSRNVKFWDEARYAETRGDLNALEVMYWCVMLGFRGAWRDKPDWIEAWTARIGSLLDGQAEQVPPPPLDHAASERPMMPETALPYRRMLFTAMLSLSFVIPVVLLFYWRH
jgi:type VI protein secretion system component VasF